MQRSLQSFPLSIGQRGKLKTAGFETAEDLNNISVTELSRELSISNSEALAILNVVASKSDNPSPSLCLPTSPHPQLPHPAVVGDTRSLADMLQGQSALELLRIEKMQSSIVTFSEKVDGLLGGGVSLGKITELCGAPGIGKTQFSMQLAVDVGIPELFGGVEGESIYIDTEGSFIVERAAEIAAAAVQHISNVVDEKEDPETVQCAKEFTLNKVLSGIHYFRCHDYVELVALVNILPQIVAEHPKIKLVVVDSVAAPFRHGFDNMGMRNRILSGMAQNLIKLATLSNMAIVLTNQMTTKPCPQDPASARLVPALGESWGHICTIRVVLYWNQSQRFVMLYKSPTRKEGVVPFQVTQDGVRDVVESSEGRISDADATRDFMSLTSSQFEEIKNSPGDNYIHDEQEFLIKELEQIQDMMDISGTESDALCNQAGAFPNFHEESSRKRTHPDF